jgi:PTH2 family peptidyl-tRNA hydrolase
MEQNQNENKINLNNEINNTENNNNNTNSNNNNSNDNNSNNISNQLKNEILDFGFDSEKIDLAMKISSNKEEIINLIVQMMEQPEFYTQLKSQTFQQNTQLQNIFQQPQQYKMVIVVRTDLNMSLGKVSAQVGHAVLGAYKLSLQNDLTKTNNWENFSGQAKIVLGVSSKEELFDIQNKAREAGLVTCLIHDAGRTQVAPNTPTCCAIGPDLVENIDKITGKLKLL